MDKLTRRKFLNASIGGYICFPSLTTMLLNSRAIAAGASPVDAPAFIAIDLQGGASIAGNNIIVYDKGGELLSDYKGLGLVTALHPKESGNISEELGLAMHINSPMLRGMRTQASGAFANINGCVICTQSADDTSNNELASAPGVFLGGAQGSIVPLLGSNPATSVPGGSGGNSSNPFASGVAPTLIQNIESAKQLVSAGKVWSGATNLERAKKVLELAGKLNSTQGAKWGQLQVDEQVAAVLKAGYLKAGDLMSGEHGVDPLSDSATKNINIAGREAAAEIGYMILKGYAGAGTITMGGYDYHDSSATTGEQRDQAAGEVIGMLLAMAAALKRKVMIHVYTDGGVYGGSSTNEVNGVDKYVWQGDSEARSAAFVLVYDPQNRPNLLFKQMGAYKSADGGTVDLSPARHARISSDPRAQAAAVVANWLAWQGREQDFARVMGDSPITDGELEDYLFIRGS